MVSRSHATSCSVRVRFRLHHQSGDQEEDFNWLLSVLECVLRAFCMRVSVSASVLCSPFPLLLFLRVVTLILSILLCEICEGVRPSSVHLASADCVVRPTGTPCFKQAPVNKYH